MLSLHHRWRPRWRDWRKSRFDGKAVFWREPSTNTFEPGEVVSPSKDPERRVRIQNRFFVFVPSLAATHWVCSGGPKVYSWLIWLQRMSTTEACLMKIVLKDGTWQGTWFSRTRRCHCRKKRRREFANSRLNVHGAPEVRKHEVLAFPSTMQWCCRWLAGRESDMVLGFWHWLCEKRDWCPNI